MEEIIRFVLLAQTDCFTVTELCERFGISRVTGYKHLERPDPVRLAVHKTRTVGGARPARATARIARQSPMNTNTENKPVPTYVGVDIGKAGLDVSFAGQSPCRYANSAAGIAELIKVLKKLQKPQVVCEPSGGYERDLLDALWAAGLAVSLVHAARVRAFARAQGRLAKSDPIDAVVLREFGELMRPGTLTAPSPERERLAALVQRREHIVNILSMEEQRLAQTRDAVVRKMCERLLKELEAQLEEMDELIAAHIETDATLKNQSERLQQIQGVGPVTAMT
jgi:transposase